MPGSRHHVVLLLRRADFRRLYATRISSQFADGVFQAGLAGSVLFNPDRQTDPLEVALGFAVLLLPYSVLGPFVGVLLDRWSRRNVLVVANLVRASLVPAVAALIWSGQHPGAFLLLALVTIGVNRFFLAGVSASMRHVAPTDHLVTGNSLATTTGTIVYAAGIGAAVALRELVGGGNHGYAVVALAAIPFYLGASLLARGFARDYLGPDTERDVPERLGDALAGVARGMTAGVRHIAERRGAGYALAAISAHRLLYGVSTIAILLLYRNYFDGWGPFRAREVGLGQAVIAGALGAFVAAAITPAATRRMPGRRWIVAMLALAALVGVTLGVWYTTTTMVAAAFLAGLAAQGMKIVTDTAIQTECDDVFRGRVFSVYDTLFNVCLVAGLLLGALSLPDTGRSYAVLTGVSAGYLAIAGWYAWASGRWARREVRVLERV